MTTSLLDIAAPRVRAPAPDTDTLKAWRREEPALIRAWQETGCERSLVKLLERYNGYIRSQVQRILSGRSLSETYRQDLIQEAQLAFVQAVTSFNPAMGTQLSTHVMGHIRPALLKYALDYRNSYRIGTSSNERKAFYAALTLRARKIQEGEGDVLNDADIETIRKTTGASEQSTRRAVSSLYTSRADIHDGPDLSSDECDDDAIADLSVSRAMEALAPFIEGLDARQRAILDCYLSDQDVSTRELAERFSITPERIGQIRRDMLADMALFLKKQGIEASDLF